MAEVNKTIAELHDIIYTYRAANKKIINKAEETINKEIEEIESTFKLAGFFKKIFPFFR